MTDGLVGLGSGLGTLIMARDTLVSKNKSKHLKGQLDPPVSDVTFLDQGGQLDPPVSDVTFLDQGGQLDPP